jgi:hypothetical protein
MGAPVDEALASAGEATLAPGQDIHPCTEGLSYCLEGESGIVYGRDPGTGPAIAGGTLLPGCRDESLPSRRVSAMFKDKTLLLSEPDGVSKIMLKSMRSAPGTYRFKAQGKVLDLGGASGATHLRQTLVVGDTCMTSSLVCADKGGGKTKQCRAAVVVPP